MRALDIAKASAAWQKEKDKSRRESGENQRDRQKA
jgi:hypothetical protein